MLVIYKLNTMSIVASAVSGDGFTNSLKEAPKRGYILMVKKYLASIKKAKKEYRRGQVFTHEQIFGKIYCR